VWRSPAPCAGKTDLFFSFAVEDHRSAKAICAGCPLKVPCLAVGLARGEPDGVWGGMTTAEREGALAALRRERDSRLARNGVKHSESLALWQRRR